MNSGQAFEEQVADLYRRAGKLFVQRTPQQRRSWYGTLGQVDLQYVDPERGHVLCECKYRSRERVTRKDVVYFVDVLHRHAHPCSQADVVTNTGFSSGARTAAAEYGVRLVHVTELERLAKWHSLQSCSLPWLRKVVRWVYG